MLMTRVLRGGRFFLGLAVCLVAFSWANSARAYAWMVKHEYSGCNQCHADPSGGGLLTLYGRAQGEILLRTRYRGGDDEAGQAAWFLFGAVHLPDDLLLGGDVREMFMQTRTAGATPVNQTFLMQADLEGELSDDRMHANVSVGYAEQGGLLAAITHKPDKNVVSRVHWVGIDIGKDSEWMLRAGRMNLPFGVRSVEHTMWVRTATRTDVDTGQQHGIALAYNSASVRGEAMFIAGNFQLQPDDYRDRGYSAYIEFNPRPRLSLGLSALGVHAERDLQAQVPVWRQAYGVFARFAPWKPIVLLGEADLLVHSEPPTLMAWGYADMVQIDAEVVHGFHLMATGEAQNPPPTTQAASYRGWGSLVWFFAPHADVRGDAIWQSTPAGPKRSESVTLLAQLHLFL
jgi:hypothetical protein